MNTPTIVHIRTTQWANPFARRRLEQRLDDEAPLAGTDWLIEYLPSESGDAIHVEGPNITASDRLTIMQTAISALHSAIDEEYLNARR